MTVPVDAAFPESLGYPATGPAALGGITAVVRGDRDLPQAFCWTRFGTEAGESIETILARKEAERQANDGIFLWGIGTSVAPGLRELLRRGIEPEVLFSPIRGRARDVDVAPPRVVTWRSGETIAGDAVELPPAVRVLSRAPVDGNPSPHYALVCWSAKPLKPSQLGTLEFAALQNLVSGSQLGASQVTAVVARSTTRDGGAVYPVVLRVSLAAPYFLRLRTPTPVLQIA
jgi:hypothetical protein